MFELLALGVMGWAAKRFLNGITSRTTEESDRTPEWHSMDGEEQRRTDYGGWKGQRDDAEAALKRREDAWFNH